MRIKHILFLVPIMLVTLTLMAMVQTVEAKRFGGGRSFGGRSSYSNGFSRSTPSKSFGQQGSRSGLNSGASRSRWGGMFGGLMGGMLMGGLLGSMFGGGHFMGPNIMDFLLIGGGIFLLMRFLRKRRETSAGATSSGGNPFTMNRESTHSYDASPSSGSAWDNLRSGGNTQAGMSGSAQAINVPPGFDKEDFLKGAKAVYQRLQTSWDKRDLDDIRQFSSPDVYTFIQEQNAQDPTPSVTEILLINGELLEVKAIGNQTVATVYFDVLMREDSSSQDTEQVREVWHFSKYDNKTGDHWVVEGIQQLEN